MIVHSPRPATSRTSFRDLFAQFDPMPVSSTGIGGAACQDCGAGTGAECADDCETRAALDRRADELDESNACCPSPAYAAATLCGCGGYSPRPVAS